MAVTIRDLASKLNLSITTVSRALDGYDDVAEETRKRVVEAARQMGYVPSAAARQLRRKRTDAIGYILPTSSPRFSDPFYVNFLTGLCDEIASHHLDTMVTSSEPDSPEEKQEYRRWVQSHRVDGMVLNRIRVNDWRVNYLSEQNMPFVTLNSLNYHNNRPCVCVDEGSGVQTLVKHLIDKGHRRLAFIGGPENLVIHQERIAGYRKGLEAAGISLDPALTVPGDLTEEGGYRAALELLSQRPRPTAILGCNDLTALGAARAAKDRGIYIGTELAIAGYDGIQETEHTNPPITTLYQPTYEIARQIADMLIRLIEGKPLETQQVVLQPELIIRPSTG